MDVSFPSIEFNLLGSTQTFAEGHLVSTLFRAIASRLRGLLYLDMTLLMSQT